MKERQEERRAQSRLAARFPVIHILGEDERHACVVEDLSATGMCVVAAPGDDELPHNRYAWLQFHLPGDEVPIRALGELCHEGGASRGFRFKYIYPRDRRRFEAFVREHASEALAS